MSDPFIGEIKMFGGNFAPRGFAMCDGQLLAISQNDALFSLFGTIYGGDGRTTFGLPDMRGRVPIHMGTGPGLSPRTLGSKAGAENVTLSTSQIPSHSHPMKASTGAGNSNDPTGHVTSASPSVDLWIEDSPSTGLASSAITMTGGNASHTNIAPYQCINYIVALIGVYPSRN